MYDLSFMLKAADNNLEMEKYISCEIDNQKVIIYQEHDVTVYGFLVTNLIIQKPLHLRIAYSYFDSNICSDHKRWEKLLSCTVSFCIENSSNTESSLSKDTFPFIPSHNEAWKVFKRNGMHIGHQNVNSSLSKMMN